MHAFSVGNAALKSANEEKLAIIVFNVFVCCKYSYLFGQKQIFTVKLYIVTKIYIQVAYMLLDEAAVQREFGNLLEIPDNYPKYVVTMDEMQSGGNYQGIKQISLRNFLLAEDKERL